MKEAQRVSVLRPWSCMWPSEGRPGPALPSGHSKRAGAPERTGEEVLGSGGGHGGQDGVGGAPKPWGQDAESRTREWGERRAGEEPQGGGRLAGGGLGECPGCVCPHAAPGPGSPASPVEAACFRSLSGRCRARHPGFPPSDVPTPSSVPEGLPPSRWERMKRALTLRTPRHPQARPCRPGAPLSPSPGAPPAWAPTLPRTFSVIRQPGPPASSARPSQSPGVEVPPKGGRSLAAETKRPSRVTASEGSADWGRPDSLPAKGFVLGPLLRLQSRRPGSCCLTEVSRAGPGPTPQGGLGEPPADRGRGWPHWACLRGMPTGRPEGSRGFP